MSRANPRFHRVNPSLPPVGANNGVTLYRIIGKIENQLTISGCHFFGANNNPTNAQLTTLLVNIGNGVFPTYKNLISADWTCVQEVLAVVHRNDIASVFRLSNQGVAGGRPAGHLPTEAAAWCLKNTGFKGQHGRGRMSIPAISTADVTNSTLTGAVWLAAAILFDNSLLANYSDGANNWTGALGQRSAAPPHLVTNVATLSGASFVNLLLGTVRRRKIGRGK